ncbi:recombinase zinc ribbon domain-containing protein [Klebsiella aerogenes]|uniref:zinc ribbon domain-containing protein n=1 Tax=Klebsiella aerogenes TaxID=548 RepID=UPI002B1BE396|nr:zinc ribbon domain-containing protein [Klebsiella aerogenes]
MKDSVGNSHTTTNGDGEYVKNSIFSTICRCGRCGGAMYNNIVNARRSDGKIDTYNYLRCINEKDGISDSKSRNYSVLEKGIIQHIKGLNFDTLVKCDNNSELELLRLQEVELLRDVAFYDEKIKTAKAAGKKVNPTYREGIAEAEEVLDEVQAKIGALRDIHINVEELVSVNESIFDTSEYEPRASYRSLQSVWSSTISRRISTVSIFTIAVVILHSIVWGSPRRRAYTLSSKLARMEVHTPHMVM